MSFSLPEMLNLPMPLLAVGADLKLVTAVAYHDHLCNQPLAGSLAHPQIRAEWMKAISDCEEAAHVQPQAIVCDLHPDYVSGRYARERAQAENLRLLEVQHHHAHIASCLAENHYMGRAFGLAFDGTGFGLDGRIWGGELLLADFCDFQRLYHLEYLPLPGGDAATKRPYRLAIAYLHHLLPDEPLCLLFPEIDSQEIAFIKSMVAHAIHCPLTSSMGRLFDAVSALLGLCHVADYEAQAAIALEQAATLSRADGLYTFTLENNQIHLAPLFTDILNELRQHIFIPDIARRFHRTVAEIALCMVQAAQSQSPLPLPVALSGGVWQNQLLREMTVSLLQGAGFVVLQHKQVPTHDGGLAYGQTAVAAARLRSNWVIAN